MFGSALLRREGVRGFGFGIGCSGVIQMTQEGRRQVGIGRIGVGTVTVMTGNDLRTSPGNFVKTIYCIIHCHDHDIPPQPNHTYLCLLAVQTPPEHSLTKPEPILGLPDPSTAFPNPSAAFPKR